MLTGGANREEGSTGTSAEGQRASLETENAETSLFKPKCWPVCDLNLKLSKWFHISTKEDRIVVGCLVGLDVGMVTATSRIKDLAVHQLWFHSDGWNDLDVAAVWDISGS